MNSSLEHGGPSESAEIAKELKSISAKRPGQDWGFLVASWVLLNACWGCSWNFMRLSFGNAEAPVELWLTGPPTQTSWQLLQDFGSTKHISLNIYIFISMYIYIDIFIFISIYIYLNLGWLMMTGLKRLIASWVKWSFLRGFPGCWISWDTFRFGFSTWTFADLWGWPLGVLQPDWGRSFHLHPGRLTWNLKMMVWKMTFNFNLCEF